ncbi:MAG: hypothetical protein RPU13_13845 [Candidatus Sedimenticola sp. (ex Thyasira tokunagai)]
MDEDLAAWQAPEGIREQAAAVDDVFPVLETNLNIVNAWMAVQTQFTRAGFRYEGMEAGLRMAAIESPPELFAGLQVMEAAAIKALNEQS